MQSDDAHFSREINKIFLSYGTGLYIFSGLSAALYSGASLFARVLAYTTWGYTPGWVYGVLLAVFTVDVVRQVWDAVRVTRLRRGAARPGETPDAAAVDSAHAMIGWHRDRNAAPTVWVRAGFMAFYLAWFVAGGVAQGNGLVDVLTLAAGLGVLWVLAGRWHSRVMVTWYRRVTFADIRPPRDTPEM